MEVQNLEQLELKALGPGCSEVLRGCEVLWLGVWPGFPAGCGVGVAESVGLVWARPQGGLWIIRDCVWGTAGLVVCGFVPGLVVWIGGGSLLVVEVVIGAIGRMVVLHGKLRLTSREVLLPVLPWIIAFCGNVVANKCTSGLTSLAAPTCEVLTSVKAGTLVIPAAIPLLPKATNSEGAKGKQASLKSKWGKRNVDKLRLDEVYEGSFNFVYPGDHWLAGINSFEAQGLEDEEATGRHEKRSSIALIPPGPLKYRRGKRLLADQGWNLEI